MAFNPNSLTEQAAKVYNAAAQVAKDKGHSQLMPVHLAVALMEDSDNLIPNIFQKAGGNPRNISQELAKGLQKLPSQTPPPTPSLSQALLSVLQEADQIQK
eukprot:gene28092-36257_t